MKEYVFSLASGAPYFQSRQYDDEVPHLAKESANDYEKRTWRNRTHVNADGQIIIPAEAIHHSIRDASAYLSEKIPGKGHQTWTKHFRSGIMVPDDLVLPERRETVDGIWLRLNPQGKSGGGTRVAKCLPVIREWAGDVKIVVLDDLITDDVLLRTVQHAGAFIGIGQNRPEKGGRMGRFSVVEWVAGHGAPELRVAAE
jgi:hypothetical protein